MKLNHQLFDFRRNTHDRSDESDSDTRFASSDTRPNLSVIDKNSSNALELSLLEQSIVFSALSGKCFSEIKAHCMHALGNDSSAFWLACDRLYDLHILSQPVTPLSSKQSVSRRRLVTTAAGAVLGAASAQAAAIPIGATAAEETAKIAQEENAKSAEQGAKNATNAPVEEAQNKLLDGLERDLADAEEATKSAKKVVGANEQKRKVAAQEQMRKVQSSEDRQKQSFTVEKRAKHATEDRAKESSRKQLQYRVATVPEPSPVVFIGLGIGAAWLARRNLKKH